MASVKLFAFAVLVMFSMDLISGQEAPRTAAGRAPVPTPVPPAPWPRNFSVVGINVGSRPHDAVISG
jgi:hypothetical protein